MNYKMIFNFARGLLMAVLAGYAVAAIAALVTGDYEAVTGLVMKGLILGGMNILSVWES